MKRTIALAVFAYAMAGQAAAQTPPIAVALEGPALAAAPEGGRGSAGPRPSLALPRRPIWDQAAPAQQARTIAGDAATGALAQPPRAAAAQRPSLSRRRRGSMVGYVDDATVESKIRVRFDTAFHNTAPDRAEFFYAKCGCYSGLPANDPGFDPEAPGPRPGAASDLNFQQLFLEGEYAIDSSISVFGQVPLRWLQPKAFIPRTGGSFPDQSGAGDVRAGLKLGLADTDASGVTAKFQVYLPTGDARKGLGTNHASFEPALLFHQTVSEVVALESQIGVWLPIGGSAPVPTAADGRFAGRVFYYGIGPSFTVYDDDRMRVTPVVELVGWRVLKGNLSPGLDASGTNIVNLKIGGRLSYEAGSIYVGYGRALTDATWYDDIVRFEYRYSF
jgi:hypothetical protein